MNKKKPFVHPSLAVNNISKKDNIYTWSRATIIQPFMINKKIGIYNGKSFTSIIIKKEMVGCRLGEFSRTRKRGSDSRTK
ncbi:MAG: S19 family ribosomal protein [Granulosicoccus sp.]